MKLVFVIILSLTIGIFLNAIYEKNFLKKKPAEQSHLNEDEYMERSTNDGCQTSIRLIIFCLVGLVVSLGLVTRLLGTT